MDAVTAMRADSPHVFDEWPSNAISTSVVEGRLETLASAPVGAPSAAAQSPGDRVAGRARALAYWDYRLDELVYLPTQAVR